MSEGASRARKAPPERRIASMFDLVVPRYDLVNTLLSMGLDTWWRRRASMAVPSLPDERVLDLGCGTGKLTARFVGRADVVGIDVSERMVAAARTRVGRGVGLVRGSAFALPFADASFMGVVSAFVLRNLDDLPLAFAELARVVAPGGAIGLVDITGPGNALLRKPFDAYFGTAAPALGALFGEAEAYRYLASSLAQLPVPPVVARMLRDAGFEGARARALAGGMVTLWTGIRAPAGTK